MAIRKPIQEYVMAQQVATTGATGSSGPITLRFADFDSMIFALTASSMSATATLDVWVQSSFDGGSTFYDIAKFPSISASSASPRFVAASLFANSNIGLANVNTTTISSTAGGTLLPLLSNVFQIVWGLNGTTPSASFGVTGITSNFNRGGQ